MCKKIVIEGPESMTVPQHILIMTHATLINITQKTSLSHGHTFIGYVWMRMKTRGRLKERRSVQFALVNQVSRLLPTSTTCGNPVGSAFDHLVDGCKRASINISAQLGKSLPLKITQRAKQTLMPVVNCLKAPGRGALGNRLWNLFSPPLLPTDSPRS